MSQADVKMPKMHIKLPYLAVGGEKVHLMKIACRYLDEVIFNGSIVC